jgi:asparagine synthase (glutamine-hydrolysing)
MSEPAAIPTAMVSRLARETVTVVLTGEGGDELFAGYPKYAVEPVARRIAALPRRCGHCCSSGVVDRLPFAFRKLQVVGRSARFRDESERLAAGSPASSATSVAACSSPNSRRMRPPGSNRSAAALADTSARMPLDRMLDADLRIWLTDDLLMKMDKMSMAASIEARVPFLDVPFIEWAMRVGHEHKIAGLEGKVLLKRLAPHAAARRGRGPSQGRLHGALVPVVPRRAARTPRRHTAVVALPAARLVTAERGARGTVRRPSRADDATAPASCGRC